MPQLNPAPWLMILIFTWVVFLMVLPSKVMAHQLPNEPISSSKKDTGTPTWNWQWS